MFDLNGLRAAVAAHGRVARLVVAAHDGSSPREVGAAMLVWADGMSGTIGGGALEWEAVARARDLLAKDGGGGARLDREALGPKLGQCCGGRVSVLTELHDAGSVAALEGREVIARPVGLPGQPPAPMPLAVKRILAGARAKGQRPPPRLVQGWMIEPLARPSREVWVWGAGHVGRALVSVLAPLPDLRLTWIDTARARFPEEIPEGVAPVWTETPALLAGHAPEGAEHLIITYSHALDLELCHRLLGHGFGWLGLIGSDTKWARFRSRLAQLGHGATSIARITCPIGAPALGKHPQAIAVGVAVQLLERKQQSETEITEHDGERGTSAAGGPDQGLSGRGRQ
ncbi:xanthine dehydrogenase accessory protein XdhC [Pseudogemmobacter sonorensis]|uniref:xanthine dehydrogenase accessory protein XdhC n=1 Tax=Pseudogemmobacter sonorensis TaxID=2989681 RepID=UPI0036A5A63B